MNKRFKIGDIIIWRDISIEGSPWSNGLFWKQDFSHVTIYFPELLLISKTIKTSDLEIFPELDVEKINTYITGLISDEKISYPYKDIYKRISEETGGEIYAINQFILGKVIKAEKAEWLEELTWCLSQLYCRFIDNNSQKIYCIYLRWRHKDPWSVELIPCLPDGKLNYNKGWEIIKTKRDYSQNDYEELKLEALNIIRDRFKEITWLSSDNDIDDD